VAGLEAVVSGAADSVVEDLEAECPADSEVGCQEGSEADSAVEDLEPGCQEGSEADSAVEDLEPGCQEGSEADSAAAGSGARVGVGDAGPEEAGAGAFPSR
jgi:hypothetical protein